MFKQPIFYRLQNSRFFFPKIGLDGRVGAAQEQAREPHMPEYVGQVRREKKKPLSVFHIMSSFWPGVQNCRRGVKTLFTTPSSL